MEPPFHFPANLYLLLVPCHACWTAARGTLLVHTAGAHWCTTINAKPASAVLPVAINCSSSTLPKARNWFFLGTILLRKQEKTHAATQKLPDLNYYAQMYTDIPCNIQPAVLRNLCGIFQIYMLTLSLVFKFDDVSRLSRENRFHGAIFAQQRTKMFSGCNVVQG